MSSALFKRVIKRLTPTQERIEFTRKVLLAARSNHFSPKEFKRLEKLLDSINKRDLILLYGVISTMKLSNLSQTSVRTLRSILSKAYQNILAGSEPFNKRTMAEITTELEKALSKKVASKLTQELLSGDETFVVGLLNYLSTA
ncbi:hypothetical protein HY570_02095 [Candidatus Micrarchaeota archaeon]|nr:hypothetical protein [Candidatus Micrarchaeota archaeon]